MSFFQEFLTQIVKKIDSPQVVPPSTPPTKMVITAPDAQLIELRKGNTNDRYVALRLLGKGGNGKVHLCRDTKDGTLVALKTIYFPDAYRPPREVSILKALGPHSNIVQYHTMLPHPHMPEHVQLVFEYCPMGDIIDHLKNIGKNVPEQFLWHILKHISCALSFLHARDVIHGDIKPDNILLTAQRDGESYPLPKVADFGCATIFPPRNIPRGHLATPEYSPPEATTKYGPEADIWALGCVIYELATDGTLPCQSLEKPGEEWDAKSWFATNNFKIPDGTQDVNVYIDMVYFKAFHPSRPLSIHRRSTKKGGKYSKLLNFILMMLLNTNPHQRIQATDLHRITVVLEPLVRQMVLTGQNWILDMFEEKKGMELSIIFRDMFQHVVEDAFREEACEVTLRKAMKLLPLMWQEDHDACLQFAAELGNVRRK